MATDGGDSTGWGNYHPRARKFDPPPMMPRVPDFPMVRMLHQQMQSGSNSYDGKDFSKAIREIMDAGWKRNDNRPEQQMGRTTYPWWIDPLSGAEFRGLRHVFQVVVSREDNSNPLTAPEADPPSPQAAAILDALLKKPDLAKEIHNHLSRHYGI